MKAHLKRLARVITLLGSATWIGAASTSVEGRGSSGAGRGPGGSTSHEFSTLYRAFTTTVTVFDRAAPAS